MKRALPALATVSLLALAGCGSTSGDDASAERDGGLAVAAAFYPLQWASEQVGGDHVEVTSLTKPGAEPHDLELTPKDVTEMASADVVVYLAGFQPAVDDAVSSEAQEAGFDVSPEADLDLAAPAEGHDHGEEGAEEEHKEGQDPHFWLDPVRFEQVVTAIGERFATEDPDNAQDYRANAEATVADLKTLDEEYRTGLADCASTDLVTGHAAFGYLAERYGLSQEGIAGLSPDVEPDAATLRELAAHIEEHGVTTVYSETLVSPDLAETLARETGASVAVLDPIEGITDETQGSNYLEVMRSNLTTLEQGQQCH
ncbi:zinc ABC transporter substrate-binding protein [Phycicoccus endophyticus]|uniref:Zinc ABC transporter substrate-binding protein n=1 Tax=Phycicoccus endophyticus TaxID=1690220 RepID=A0A7G9R3X0_9MICO|nr:zinc ABC transporter substrate-binding protein [Phycicoccus endophyticus]NHI18129.1 zinc ABC transporter substrate-binding protein [Phycicoccus endophyticus]QNN50295.1 zinc ABC transporter substrate-binding protein [Phycicoccus endophyticus]GGL26211.1 zinc ABC transporter substrate-binding protein [Phycicoccus endophyticus]